MKRKNIFRLTILVFILSIFLNGSDNFVSAKSKDWKKIDSEHFVVYYSKISRKLAQKSVAQAERELRKISKELDIILWR